MDAKYNVSLNNEEAISEDDAGYNIFAQMFPEYHEILEYIMLFFNIILMIAVFVFGMRMARQNVAEDVEDDTQDDSLDAHFKLDDPIPNNDPAGSSTDESL